MDREIIGKVHEVMRGKGLTLAAAESCTGGMLGSMITSLPGASAFFKASVVAYSAEIKLGVLGVSAKTIESHGMVSEECAAEMARGVEKLTKADVAVAITGAAGPEPCGGREPGIAYIAVSSGKGVVSRGFKFTGDRESVKKQAAEKALHLVYETVSLWG